MAEQVQQVTMKDPKKVEQGKRLAERNCRKREQMKVQTEGGTNLTYYDAGAAIAIGVLGIIEYYVYWSRTHKETPVNQPKETPVQQLKKTPDKLDMDQAITCSFIENPTENRSNDNRQHFCGFHS